MKWKLYITALMVVLTIEALGQNLCKQDDKFKLYQSFFQKLDYPFAMMIAYDKTSKYEVPPLIPDTLLEKYVCNQGISCKTSYCDSSKYIGFSALCQLPDMNGFKILTIAEFSEPGCGERMYILSYTQSGVLVDSLRFYGSGYWDFPNFDKPNGQTYDLEGIIYGDSVVVKYIQHIGEIIREGKRRNIYNQNSNSSYKINDKGRFEIMKIYKNEGYEYFE